MADHVALIARLEALTGPDREVDALLFRRGNKSPVGALAATPAIALCLALLRSKHHGGGNG